MFGSVKSSGWQFVTLLTHHDSDHVSNTLSEVYRMPEGEHATLGLSISERNLRWIFLRNIHLHAEGKTRQCDDTLPLNIRLKYGWPCSGAQLAALNSIVTLDWVALLNILALIYTLYRSREQIRWHFEHRSR